MLDEAASPTLSHALFALSLLLRLPRSPVCFSSPSPVSLLLYSLSSAPNSRSPARTLLPRRTLLALGLPPHHDSGLLVLPHGTLRTIGFLCPTCLTIGLAPRTL